MSDTSGEITNGTNYSSLYITGKNRWEKTSGKKILVEKSPRLV